MGGGESSSRTRTTAKGSTRGLGLKNSGGGGEIVEVQGGHIMRSIGRKDRHSKVCTAKGPRDRRVRLAAHTAIQFYDVQDRLGYDRPSKAVDWLIKKAKAAIDKLGQLPSWHPTSSLPNASLAVQEQEDEAANKKKLEEGEEENQEQEQHGLNQADDLVVSSVSGKRAAMAMLGGEHEHPRLNQNTNNSSNRDSSFLPPSLDSDSIADTIKSFFPMGGPSAESSSSSMQQFQRFSIPDLLPRTSNSHSQSQDLRLSLQSLQDPILLQQHHQSTHQHHHQNQVLLSGTPLCTFDAATLWSDHHNNSELNSNASESGLYNPTHIGHHPHHHNQLFTQRGPLQSSNTPSFRAWMDYPTLASADYNQQQGHYIPSASVMPMYPSGMGYHQQPGISGFSGFHIPARIQGDEEEHDGYSDKPSSASSDSRH